MPHISNFQLVETREPIKGWVIHEATVDIERRFLWWKRVETVTVYKTSDYLHWFFAESGEYTPEYTVENLAKAYKVKKGIRL